MTFTITGRLAAATALTISLGLALTAPVRADVVNGGFETGDLTGWSSAGNVTTGTSAVGSGPVEGSFQAELSNGGAAVDSATLEGFLGLTPGALDSLGEGLVINGSAIQQTFSASAGDTLSFSWDLLTNELDQPAEYNDFAFFTLTPTFGGPTVLADTTAFPFTDGPAPWEGETGYVSDAFTLPTTGSYTLGFGVVNVLDNTHDSALLVDAVSLQSAVNPSPPSTSTVPEPAGLTLLLAGVLPLTGLLRRRRLT